MIVLSGDPIIIVAGLVASGDKSCVPAYII